MDGLSDKVDEFLRWSVPEARKELIPVKLFGRLRFDEIILGEDEQPLPRMVAGSGDVYKAILIEDVEEYRALFGVIREYHPKIRDSWIEWQVKHESEHLAEARRIVGSRKGGVIYYYGAAFLEIHGKEMVAPFYTFFLSENTRRLSPEEMIMICSAPEQLSPDDRADIVKYKEMIDRGCDFI